MIFLSGQSSQVCFVKPNKLKAQIPKNDFTQPFLCLHSRFKPETSANIYESEQQVLVGHKIKAAVKFLGRKNFMC